MHGLSDPSIPEQDAFVFPQQEECKEIRMEVVN